MLKQTKALVGSLIIAIAAFTLIAGSVNAQENDQSGCGCCNKMQDHMNQTSG